MKRSSICYCIFHFSIFVQKGTEDILRRILRGRKYSKKSFLLESTFWIGRVRYWKIFSGPPEITRHFDAPLCLDFYVNFCLFQIRTFFSFGNPYVPERCPPHSLSFLHSIFCWQVLLNKHAVNRKVDKRTGAIISFQMWTSGSGGGKSRFIKKIHSGYRDEGAFNNPHVFSFLTPPPPLSLSHISYTYNNELSRLVEPHLHVDVIIKWHLTDIWFFF